MSRKKKSKGHKGQKVLLCMMVLLGITVTAGCGAVLSSRMVRAPKTEPQEIAADTGFIPELPGSYDSADTAVIVEKNEEKNTITFFNIPTGRNYTLTYDGTTRVADKYGKEMTMQQISAGDVMDITFLKSKKKLRSMALSTQVWTNRAEGNYEINLNGKGLQVAQDQYELAGNVMVLSEDKQVELMDINTCDSLILQGIGRTIYSIKIDKGHGYLKLDNAEYFNGGWIEVGQAMIQPVTEDMLLTVPEGKYDVLITNTGHGGTKSVTINRNEETILDVGDLKGEETKLGNIVFTVMPMEATVYVDGKKMDISEPVSLEYGIHQLIVRAEGYETMSKYLKVGQANANITLELEKSESSLNSQDEKDKNNSKNTSTDNQDTGQADSDDDDDNDDYGKTPSSTDTVNATGEYRIYITSPQETEVYFDGKYMGLAPLNFNKESGTHVVTLRRSGYQTRSFTIQIDDEDKDISWSFSELEKIEE